MKVYVMSWIFPFEGGHIEAVAHNPVHLLKECERVLGETDLDVERGRDFDPDLPAIWYVSYKDRWDWCQIEEWEVQ